MELCIVHAGPLPPSVWGRLRAHLPLGSAMRVLDLEAITPYWEAGRSGDPGELTVAELVRRLRFDLDPRSRRVLLGWGFGGLVAHALAGDADHALALDTTAPAAEPAELPDEALLAGFAAYLAVRRGRALHLVPAPPVDAALTALAGRSGAAGLRRLYVAYARGRRRDRALAVAHTPPERPLTLVRAARGPAGALGWEGHAGLERLESAGDHYSMLTDPAAVAHLAALLHRWLAPPGTTGPCCCAGWRSRTAARRSGSATGR
jgi:thioesterase domain-containing protein